MSKKPSDSKISEHKLIIGSGSKLAKAIAKNKWSSDLKNHPWYDSKYNTEKGGLQAHHIVTTESLDGHLWKLWREAYEYDINRANNGVILPSSTIIACQVETHVHRSNHNRGLDYDTVLDKYWGGKAKPEEIPDEECEKLYSELRTYLKGVNKQISEIKKRAEKKYYCKSSKKKEFTEDLDDAAEDIVDKLNSFHWTLSRFGKDYAPSSKIGCGGGHIESEKKSREECPHRLNITGTGHAIRNKLGKVMEPRKLEAGS
ncbi:AHH domain-containing protein [Vibrio pomeroyi]|uniref:AHH domain-containing protein n=1 Tax=Vibrio pomeroyi TaxID=198832 RepID=UPI0021C4A8B6|nr:AHH domain-containing protein [Vibrio pomeroyi]